eukprot:2837773-Rhodomonas_salina.2
MSRARVLASDGESESRWLGGCGQSVSPAVKPTGEARRRLPRDSESARRLHLSMTRTPAIPAGGDSESESRVRASEPGPSDVKFKCADDTSVVVLSCWRVPA